MLPAQDPLRSTTSAATRSRWASVVRSVGLIALLGAGLAACGGDDPESATDTTSATSTTSTSSASTSVVDPGPADDADGEALSREQFVTGVSTLCASMGDEIEELNRPADESDTMGEADWIQGMGQATRHFVDGVRQLDGPDDQVDAIARSMTSTADALDAAASQVRSGQTDVEIDGALAEADSAFVALGFAGGMDGCIAGEITADAEAP